MPPSAPHPVTGPVLPAAGIVVVALAAAWSAVFTVVFGLALSAVSPWLAAAVNLVAGAGAAPAVWRRRRVTSLRWILGGVIPGVIAGWAVLAVLAL